MYQGLPDVFPYSVVVPEDNVSRLILPLIHTAGNAPNGSSFAVTSDAPEGKRRIWLSDISFRRVATQLEEAQAEPPVPGAIPFDIDTTPARPGPDWIFPEWPDSHDPPRPRKVKRENRHNYDPSKFATLRELETGTAPCSECGNARGATNHLPYLHSWFYFRTDVRYTRKRTPRDGV
jgi:hypothetical protein